MILAFKESQATVSAGGAESQIAPAPERFSFSRKLRAANVFFVCAVSTINLNLLTATASAGFRVFWLWLLAIPCFVVPQAIAVSEITYFTPGECGLSLWSERYLGKTAGFLISWCYWLNNIPYVPSVLLYMVVAVGFIFSGLENFGPYVHCGLTLLLLWAVVGASRIGFGGGAWVKGFACATFLIVASITWMSVRYGIHHYRDGIAGITGGRSLGFPSLNLETNSVFGLICMSMIGVEIGSVFGQEIEGARTAIALASIRGSMASVICYVLATAGLLVGMRGAPLGNSTGLVDYLHRMMQGPELRIAVPVMALLICISQIGSGLCWFGAASRMLWLCSTQGGLPRCWGRLHPRWRTPDRAIRDQGILCSVIVILSFLGSAAQEAYLTLLDIAVIIQLLPYVAVFAALMRHGAVAKKPHRRFFAAAGALGAAAALFGIAMAFVPSRAVSNVWQYELKLGIGCVLSLGSGLWVFSRQSRQTDRAAELIEEKA